MYWIYFLIGCAWSQFALAMQQRDYPESKEFQIFLCFILNLSLWPICMVLSGISLLIITLFKRE